MVPHPLQSPTIPKCICFADGIELMIIIIGCFAQSLAGEAHAVNIIAVIIVWRGIVRDSFFLYVRPPSDRLFSPMKDGYWNRW